MLTFRIYEEMQIIYTYLAQIWKPQLKSMIWIMSSQCNVLLETRLKLKNICPNIVADQNQAREIKGLNSPDP